MKRNLTLLLIVIPTLIIFAQTKSSNKNYIRYECGSIKTLSELLLLKNDSDCLSKKYFFYSFDIQKNKIIISEYIQDKLYTKKIYDNLVMEETGDFFIYKKNDGTAEGSQDFMEIVISKNKRIVMYYWIDYLYNPQQKLYILK